MVPKPRQRACRSPPHGDQRAQGVACRAGARRPACSRVMATPQQTAAALQHRAQMGVSLESSECWQSGKLQCYLISEAGSMPGCVAGVMFTALYRVVPAPILYARG